MNEITVYSQPACVQCIATYRKLDALELDYTVVNLEGDPDALEHVKALGYLRAPVIIAGDEHWSGYRPDKIDAIAARIK